jgi:hypothetical protein
VTGTQSRTRVEADRRVVERAEADRRCYGIGE